MGARDGDDATVAYRRPAPTPVEIDAPASWRRPSSRVLGALARFNEAKGHDGSALVERAEKARAYEGQFAGDGPRRHARCIDGHERFARGDFGAARRLYERWIVDANAAAHEVVDRLEVLTLLAVLRRWDRQRDDAELALKEALALPTLHLREDVPLVGVLTLAGALRDLGLRAGARRLLAGRHATTPAEDGSLLRARADDALERGEFTLARELATRALRIWNTLVAPDDREHVATRLTLARTHGREGNLATADRQLTLILETTDRDSDRGLEARAWAAAAEVLCARGDADAARKALVSAMWATDRWLPGAYAVNMPVRRTRARVLDALGPWEKAATARAAVAELEAAYPACLMRELR